MGAEDLVVHPLGRHAHILQLSFDCLHERDRAAEIVVGVGRNEVGDLLQCQSAAEVVILSFDILLPGSRYQIRLSSFPCCLLFARISSLNAWWAPCSQA
jgi:hypothetical protein